MAHTGATRPDAAKTGRRDYTLPPSCDVCDQLRARLKDEVAAGRVRAAAVTIVKGAVVGAGKLMRS